jgi:hypothetical protein
LGTGLACAGCESEAVIAMQQRWSGTVQASAAPEIVGLQLDYHFQNMLRQIQGQISPQLIKGSQTSQIPGSSFICSNMPRKAI